MQLALLLFFAAAAAAEDVPATIARLEHEWSAAVLAHDVRAVDRIVADDFVGIDGRAMVSDKKDELEEAKAPGFGATPPVFQLLDEQISDIKVRVYGNTAVANAISNETARFKGKEIAPRYRRTTVWVKRDGRWQCVSFHATRIVEAPPA
jgi:ketosteroid isomerase-like protein